MSYHRPEMRLERALELQRECQDDPRQARTHKLREWVETLEVLQMMRAQRVEKCRIRERKPAA